MVFKTKMLFEHEFVTTKFNNFLNG